MESDYAKRMKIQEICYKKKLNDIQKNMDSGRQIDVSDFFSEIYLFFRSFWNKIELIFQEQTLPNEQCEKMGSEQNSRSTLQELVSQIHQLQQNIREKEMQMKRSEISANFKVALKHFGLNKTVIQKFQYIVLDWKFESENNSPREISESRKAFKFEFVCGDWILSSRIETNKWLIIINTN